MLNHECIPFCRYDVETAYFDESVRSEKRNHLEEKLMPVRPPDGCLNLWIFVTIYCATGDESITFITMHS